jgi:transposase InsO family protein
VVVVENLLRRRIVGWQFASHMRTTLVLDALRMALTRRQAGADVDLIHHSDAGSQYTSFAFLELAIVEWVAWFNTVRLHESLGDIPPAEFETLSSSSTVDLSPSESRVGTN